MPAERSKLAPRILSEATRQFAARGFDATSVQAIAEAVGIRKPSVLYHFPSKDDLRRSVLEHLLARWGEVLPKVLLAAASGQEQFDAVLREAVAFFVSDRDRARLLMREVLDRPEEMRALIREHVRPWATVVVDYLRRGQAAGRVFAGVDPEAWIVEVINLVIAGFATFDVLAPLVDPNDDPDARERAFTRHLTELLRVARASLFQPKPTA